MIDTIVASAETRGVEMELTWASGVPHSGQVMSATIDGNAPAFTRRIEDEDPMGKDNPEVRTPAAFFAWYAPA